ncbi:hypothetical protein AFERRI_420104 [Acidithiobacillus ferrivorans]|uniref:Uncharacterized protein n=1 Tax=Acidithiobacillus ferrivorans TaxID=160808 RepID=A0A060UR72_9PROT|nr:hypothetical protein AFERRI_420104 [Acidithiobacillus ferrivorans]
MSFRMASMQRLQSFTSSLGTGIMGNERALTGIDVSGGKWS